MKYNSILFLLVLIHSVFAKNTLSKISLDTSFNIYKSGITNSHLYQEISNTTWKEFFISENIQNIKKFFPYYINNDKELDLFVEDSSAQLYWINNVRGTSKDFTHKKLSKIFIGDFIVANKYDSDNSNNNDNNDMFILATNQHKNKIFKYKKNPYYNPLMNNDTLHDTKNYWEETLFLNIDDPSITSYIKINGYSKIKSLNIYQQKNGDFQILLLNIEQLDTNACNLIKIRIKEERIISVDKIGYELNNINIVGLFDMNNDGLIDILYLDSNNVLFVYLNQDPFYYSVEIYKLNPTFIDKSPRIFIIDANKDMYPDIITGDTSKNTISLILNPGRNYWKKIINYYEKKSDNLEIYKDISWQYLPLIDTVKEKLSEKQLKDFTIIMIDKSKRITFEIIGIFGNKLYWFIEKDNNNGHSLTQSIYHYLINSMVKCEIFIDKYNGNDMNDLYDIILDIDLNNDNYPEFILYSYKLEKMIYIQRIEILLKQYGWSQAFWIYLMIGIYTFSSIIGGIEFYRIKIYNENYHNSLMNNEEQKEPKEIELNEIGINHYQYK